MKTIYKVTVNENTVETTSKREYLNALKTVEGEAQVEFLIPTTNVRRLLNKGDRKVRVETAAGKTYTVTATYDPKVYGEKKEDAEKAIKARKEGKTLVYNVVAKNWQALNIVEVEVDGVWFKVMKLEPANRNRLSLEKALEMLTELGYEVKRKGSKFLVEDNGVALERTGRDIVRLAKEIA